MKPDAKHIVASVPRQVLRPLWSEDTRSDRPQSTRPHQVEVECTKLQKPSTLPAVRPRCLQTNPGWDKPWTKPTNRMHFPASSETWCRPGQFERWHPCSSAYLKRTISDGHEHFSG